MNLNYSDIKTFAENNNIIMVLLFGSRATDHFREDSDLDLAVLFNGDYNYEGVLKGFIQLFPYYTIDVVNLNKSDPLLNFQILSRHEILYCLDMEIYLRFFADTVKKNNDMQKIYALADQYLKDFTGGASYGAITCHPPKVK